jgi:NADPH:quinone reductase
VGAGGRGSDIIPAMRAIQIVQESGPDGALALVEVPEPEPSHMLTPGEGVVVDVQCAGVSFPELLQSRGQYQMKPPLPFVPGSEVSGVVRSAPAGAQVKAGERVAAFCAIGGFAETAVAPEFFTFPLSSELDFAQGAGLILNYHTAYFSLALRGRLKAGETVLVHGAAGGLGTATLQVARGLGARTIGVVSTERKAEVARAAGAEQAVLADGWQEAVRELAPGGVDVVADPVGGEDRIKASLRVLALDGRFIVLGFAGGEIPEIRTNRILFGNVAVVGAAYGAYVAQRPGVAQEVARAVNELVRAGHARPLVDVTVPLAQGADAIRRIEAREAHGKIVIEVD